MISTPMYDGHQAVQVLDRPGLTRQLNGAHQMADTYAIIEESGGQRKVTEGESIYIDLYNNGESKAGDTIEIDKVLVLGTAGGDAKLGAPYIAGASVTLEITEPVKKGDKLFIHKFRTKSTYQRKTGHRQRFTIATVAGIKG